MIVGYGPVLLSEAFTAAERMAEQGGADVAVVNLPWLNIVDEGWLATTLEGFEAVVLLDNHVAKGGQGETILAAAAVALSGAAVAAFVPMRRPARMALAALFGVGIWSAAYAAALFLSGRLYDDGVIDPRDTRTVLGLCLSVVAGSENTGSENTDARFGVFRM